MATSGKQISKMYFSS